MSSNLQPVIDAHPGMGFNTGHVPGLVPENHVCLPIISVSTFSKLRPLKTKDRFTPCVPLRLFTIVCVRLLRPLHFSLPALIPMYSNILQNVTS